MNIDDFFSEVAEEAKEKRGSVKVLSENVPQTSDTDDIAVAEPEYSHMFVFSMETREHIFPAQSLSMTLHYYFLNLCTLFDAYSVSDNKIYICYSKAAEKYLQETNNNETDDDRRANLEISQLRNQYDLVECPWKIIYKTNKAYIDYHGRSPENVSEFYIIFKCGIRKCNMQKLFKMLNSINSVLKKKTRSIFISYELKLKILYNDSGKWEPVSKSYVNFEHIKEVSEARHYQKNLEDKFVFIYKDFFYHQEKASADISLNRRLIDEFQKMIDKFQKDKIKQNWMRLSKIEKTVSRLILSSQ